MFSRISLLSICLLLFHTSLSLCKPAKRDYDLYNYYVLEQPTSPSLSLEHVAQLLEVEVVEQAGALKGHWIVRSPKPTSLATRQIRPDPVLARYAQFKARVNSNIHSREYLDARSLVSSIQSISLQQLRRRTKRVPPPIRQDSEQGQGEDDGNHVDDTSSRAVALRMGFKDPLFPSQWHLVNDENPQHMMNVVPVWDMGYTGKGVITSLIDDGLDYTSEDLKDAFDAEDSYDFNDHEDLPTPKLSADHHGTRCAGQVAARSNGACGVGIAYESQVAGVRILSGEITDVDEAIALNYGYQNVSIYSCSWGPTDDGRTMEAPDALIKKAMAEGIRNGRGGKGSVFVFASGNGYYSKDQCNFDGYTNSIFSITVSALDHKGNHPAYSEPCTANLIVAYSSGSGKSITTTDKGRNKCTSGHGGTSAAAPNAAGVFALALQARPELTWRDMQYLCVRTAKQVNPEDGWESTAIGRPYSDKYGYGVLDAYEYVKAAKEWQLVKPQTWLFTETKQLNNGKMSEDGVLHGGTFIREGGVKNSIAVTKDMLDDANFESLEHIYVKVWIQHSRRGDVEVEVVSPNGVKSVLAQPRPIDDANTGFPGWTFMSVKHWGENPLGDWTIRVWDQNHPEKDNGTFLGWNMILFGSVVDESNVKEWEVPLNDTLLPPGKPDSQEDDNPTSSPSNTTTTSTSSPSTSSLTSTTSPGSTATPASFPFTMSYMITGHPLVAVLILAIIALSIGLGIWAWRYRSSKRPSRGEEYMSLAPEPEYPMTSVSTSQLSLAASFHDGDDDEDADERSHLQSLPGRDDGRIGLSFHDGFLEDDEALTPRYRDDPDLPRHT